MISLLEVAILLGLAAMAAYWASAVRGKEIARAAGQRACRQADVQFLDDTVVLARIRLQRQGGGQIGWAREYHFEYTHGGDDRQRGQVLLLGQRVERVALDARFQS